MPRYRKQTRGHLIQVAAREFDRVGYPNASLSSVCRQAGLTTGALYHYFDSKSELALAILDGQLPRIHAMSEEVRSTTRSSLERLAYFLASLSALIAEDDLVRASTRLAVDRTVTKASDLFAPWAEIATALIDDGDSSGAVYTVDPKLLGSFATSIVVGSWFVADTADSTAHDHLVGQLSSAFVFGVVRAEDRAEARAAVERVFGS
jgi:AcrR family transcriptional regulator